MMQCFKSHKQNVIYFHFIGGGSRNLRYFKTSADKTKTICMGRYYWGQWHGFIMWQSVRHMNTQKVGPSSKSTRPWSEEKELFGIWVDSPFKEHKHNKYKADEETTDGKVELRHQQTAEQQTHLQMDNRNSSGKGMRMRNDSICESTAETSITSP